MEAHGVGMFGDGRLARLGERLLERMAELGSVHLRKLGGTRAGEMAFGRFPHNGFVTVSEMPKTAAERLAPMAAGRHVPAIQDTTELNFERHRGRKQDFGAVGNGTDIGFFPHPVLAVDAEGGHVLGLCGAEIRQRRKAKAANYQALPIEEKDSIRWLRGAAIARNALERAAMVTIVADRESDIHGEWHRVPDTRIHLLTLRSAPGSRPKPPADLPGFAQSRPKPLWPPTGPNPAEPLAFSPIPPSADPSKTGHLPTFTLLFEALVMTMMKGMTVVAGA